MTLWNDPRGRAAAARQFTRATIALDRYGEDVWDAVTWCGRDRRRFTTADVCTVFAAYVPGLAPCTVRQYVRAFLVYAKTARDTFVGRESRLTNAGGCTWYLADGPEY